MVGYITKSAGNFAPTPEGVHLMVCCQVVDLGTQPGSKMYPDPKRKIMLRWELPEQRVRYDDGDAPALHTETYTWSFHEKANLRKMLESWRGKRFVEADFDGPPNGFHIKKLLGVPMRGQVIHETNGDKTYANLGAVMPAGIKSKEDAPKVEGDTFFLDLDDFDPDTFEKLPEFWQNKIKESPEYAKATGLKSKDDGPDPFARSSVDLDDDEIPF